MSDATVSGPRVAVDPRFRQRRIEVRRSAGLRRLKRLLVLIVVAALALATVIVLRSPILDVDDVVVRGAVRTDAEEIRKLTGIEVGEPILLADLGAAAAALETLPWVAKAQVSRDLPGGVVVRITERVPVATLSVGGMAVLVDAGGRTLAPGTEVAFPPYVSVIADGDVPEVGDDLSPELLPAITLADRLRANPSGVVAAVHVAPTLRLQLVEGAVVDLGDAEGLDDKIEAFRTVYARVDRTCLERIDLRVPTHPVLTRDPDCS